jgi:D-alanyl-D-alanine carboxypeptidase (penicillin-binding protein 5/6)
MDFMRFLFCLFVLGNLVAQPLEVEVAAPSAILMNADSGAILFEKHPHTPFYPASITKIATALFALHKKGADFDQLITVSAESLKLKPAKHNGEYPPYWLESDGTKMGLHRGEEISLDALLHGLMLISGNDAANVIAEEVSGSVPLFVQEMNQYLKGLGCQNTRFCNPHGLHHPDHVTTAFDICLVTKAALSIPKFREIVSKPFYMKAKTNKQGGGPIRHTNPLFKEGKFHYPKAIGVKTGFHSYAKNTFVAAAEDKGRVLIAVLLGCNKKEERYEDAIRLFETAFAEDKEERCFFSRGHFFPKAIVGSKKPLEAELLDDLSICYYPSEEPIPRAFIHWEVPSLPIRKGQRVGEIHLLDERGVCLERKILCAKEEVKGTFFFRLKKWFP